ncbi:type II toxin-antitoxin system RelE/ParE family toxin [Pseudochrobactrum asaccharolyticum]|uniref:Toxin ParE1/3/4 n=1 Tax=Pseudochrobactrum asaccharolyticum TaxID=354351 RepID=A0A366E568_9HYPH|nr:type II toxin-antitoxin system RelE/ParE family toxin [Pseudochrobactrum asaccharolyticum]MBX8818108.1 type II toxin-antitoxin system RelE/ParE family toxin [Ochrobactrum sp. MR31]RBO97225.1 toxin ParE1/3/4 [Pseudochrobactrum asaccharolyticum]
MKIVWLPQAQANRMDLITYIGQENPRAALNQLDEIEQQIDRLIDYPEMGRVGRKRGTRELVLNRTSFVLVYRIQLKLQSIEILRLLHGAQKWPPT